MNDKKLYWIWLQISLGIENKRIRTVLEFYKNDVEAFYKDGEKGWRLCGCFTNKDIENLKDEKYLELAKGIMSKCESFGYKMITIDDGEYPERLKSIYNPPCVLYTLGSLEDIDDKVCISMVGTRSATQNGLDIAFKFSYDLAGNNCVIISGGALGIDCASHKGALQAGGKTVAVLGCGINYAYLTKLAPMRNLISKNGAVISEYPPGYPPVPRNFPVRNRIISGLSNGVLVIEAGIKSGSLITANHALEQNRDVFAVPGDIRTPTANGTNALIKEGAKTVTCVEDILNEYTHLMNLDYKTYKLKENEIEFNEELLYKLKTNDLVSETIKDSQVKNKSLPGSVSENAKKLYGVLGKTPKHIDEISIECDMKPNALLQVITELELLGVISSLSGRRYIKN